MVNDRIDGRLGENDETESDKTCTGQQDSFSTKNISISKDLSKTAEEYFMRGDIEGGKAYCFENSLPLSQFDSYLKPYEPNDSDSDFEHLILPAQLKITSIVSSEELPNKDFSYTLDELLTITGAGKFNVNIIILDLLKGARESYGSQLLMKEFNKAEYLGKLEAIPYLKQQETKLLGMYYHGIKDESIDVSDAFMKLMNHLDEISYTKRLWKKQTEFFPDKYPTTPNSQKERLMQIPRLEQEKFVWSLFYNLSKSTNNFIEAQLNSLPQSVNDLKEAYASILLNELNRKWNNEDDIFKRINELK